MAQIARFSVLSGLGGKHSLIIGEAFDEVPEAGLLKKDTIYSIQEIMGVLMLVELGPAALESHKGGRHHGWLIEDVLTGTDGAYVRTKEEHERLKLRKD